METPTVFSFTLLVGSFTGPEFPLLHVPISRKLKTIYRHLEVSVSATFSSLPLCPENPGCLCNPRLPTTYPQLREATGHLHFTFLYHGLTIDHGLMSIVLVVSYILSRLLFFSGGNVNLTLITPSLAGAEVSSMSICFYEQVLSQLRSPCLDKIPQQISFLHIA